MNKDKIKKYIEYATTKIKILYKQKKFNSNGYTLKYMLVKHDSSDNLIVVFSGIPRPGIKARYNYGSTLSSVKANKLFILDDFGYDQRGAYYLGKDKDFKIQEATKELIKKVKSNLNIKKAIYCGSSKGGWASLYFGIQDNNSSIIAGSLQYLLGKYITSNDRFRENLMSYVMGKAYTDEDIYYLNTLLKNTLSEYRNNYCDIYLHYSDLEYTYKEHMQYLLKDLDELGINYKEDIAHYAKHAEIAYYFPSFLVKTLNEII